MSKHSIGRCQVSFVAALLAAAPLAAAQAQDRDLDREPSLGKVFTGETVEGGGPARFMLTLEAGQALDLTAAPVGGSDPFIRVYEAGSDTLIAENDDSSGSLASNVRLFSESAKRVRIEVTSAAVDSSATAIRFDLILRPSAFRPKPVVPVALGDSHRGTLARGDEQLFRFRGERGQLWDLALAAAPGSGLDPALQVFAGEVAGGTALMQDDDGGGGLSARARFLVPETGTFTVRAYGVGQTEGDFAFSAGRSQATLAAALMDIELDSPASGTIEQGSAEHVFRLGARARRALAVGSGPLVVELSRAGDAEEGGTVLDPMLEIGFETPLGFTSLLTDDDSGGESNARLALDASGLTGAWLEALRIKARGFSDSTGHYQLLVTRGSSD
jgi:hypothetical protein